jgi:hypothetical protein
MPYVATVFNVLIASPGDVAAERDLAREVIYEWNATHSRSRKIVLQPIRWETHSHPTMGDRAQGVLNQQILKDADLVVAIFWTRIGTPTGEAPGGSVEELQRHMAEDKRAMVYFSVVDAPLECGASPEYQTLVTFRDEWCKPRGLLERYKSHDEFKEKFRRHLATKVNDDPYFASSGPKTATEPYNPSFLKIAERLRGGETLEDINALPDLSPEAKTLLIEAAKDNGGHIICRNVMSTGWQVTTNRKGFVVTGDPRSRARWQAAVQELETAHMILEQAARGLYQLTDEGYRAADHLSG